jgi:transposase
MSAQQALALPSLVASNTVVINARCSLRIEAGQRVIVVAGLPVHHYRAEDAIAEVYAMVFLVESGFAQQTEVARAFARSVRSVRRYQRRYAQGGMAALGREEGWRRGRRRISGKRLRSIEMPKSQGMSNRAIAHRLGLSEKDHPQIGRTFEARRERTACVCRDDGEVVGDSRVICTVDRRYCGSHHAIGARPGRRMRSDHRARG